MACCYENAIITEVIITKVLKLNYLFKIWWEQHINTVIDLFIKPAIQIVITQIAFHQTSQ